MKSLHGGTSTDRELGVFRCFRVQFTTPFGFANAMLRQTNAFTSVAGPVVVLQINITTMNTSKPVPRPDLPSNFTAPTTTPVTVPYYEITRFSEYHHNVTFCHHLCYQPCLIQLYTAPVTILQEAWIQQLLNEHRDKPFSGCAMACITVQEQDVSKKGAGTGSVPTSCSQVKHLWEIPSQDEVFGRAPHLSCPHIQRGDGQ